MTNLYAANHQWSTRPADERFWNLSDMMQHLKRLKETSSEENEPLKDLRVMAGDNNEVVLMKGDEPINFTHHSFNQISSFAGAPVEFLRKLPPSLVERNLKFMLKQRLEEERDRPMQLLVQRDEGGAMLRSVNTGITRIWNYDIVRDIQKLMDNGWMIPPARPACNDPRARPATEADIIPNQGDFGLSVKVGDMISPAGCYAGDEDIFVFVIQPNRIIDDGGQGITRGAFIRNSEVGCGRFEVTCFHLQHVCGNHIVWNASNVVSVSQVHRGGKFALMKAQHKMLEQMRLYANSPEKLELDLIHKARSFTLGTDREKTIEAVLELNPKVKHGLSKGMIEAAYERAIEYEEEARCSPNNLWGVSHGLTRLSQEESNANSRAKIDRAAGRLLSITSKMRD